MEKLLQLLNEFEESKKSDKLIGQEYYFVEEKELARGHIVWYNPTTNEHILSWIPLHAVICSKAYWFIQWLVENNKTKEVEYWLWYTSYSESDNLIRLLSIQDDPIEFLVSVLK